MITVEQWTRKHRSQLERWPIEPNPLVPAFMLRSNSEPYYAVPQNLAVLVADRLVGRFTYRVDWSGDAFVGLALSPEFRGAGLSVRSMRGCLCWLAAGGVRRAYASVAVGNIPSKRMLQGAGFILDGFEWRRLPAGYDLSLLSGLPDYSYTLGPAPALLFGCVSVALSVHMYAELAQ